MSTMSSRWLPAPVALFADKQQAVRTMPWPWCLQLSPGHPTVTGSSSGGHTAADDDPFRQATIHPAVAALERQLIDDRRTLHMHAELSFEEDFTSAFVAKRLTDLGLKPKLGMGRAPPEFAGAGGGGGYRRREAGTGVICTIEGGAGPGPCVALRADMDALPILETEGSVADQRGYRSTREGAMHACGHDGHTAMLLATAAVLAAPEVRQRLRGSVRLIFQPAEEFGGGAKWMVADGAMDGVHQVYGVHLMNFLETGTVGVKAGPLMAAPDKFSITVSGRGGHGAMPHETVDAVLCASMVITSLQTVVSRNVAPIEAAVVTVGKLENRLNSTECGCGSAFNVIADSLVLHGTTRSFEPRVRETVRRRVNEVASGVGASVGAEVTTEWDDINYGYPATINTAQEAVVCAAAARAVVGADGLRTGTAIMTMG